MSRLVCKDGRAYDLRPIHCPTCGPNAGEQELGVRGGVHHRYGLGVETRVVRCLGCGLIYPNPFPFPDDPQALYADPEKYFEGHDSAAKVQAARRLVRGLRGRLNRRSLSLLDVGSGRGELLGGARAEGIDRIVGLELSRAMVDAAREAYDVEVIPMLLEDFAAATDERFDIIILNAVLEHVYDPDSMIRACRDLIAVDGVLYLDVPNEDHLLADVAGAVNRIMGRPGIFKLAPTFPPYHVYGFSPPSLETLLKKHAFAIEHQEIRSSVSVPSRGGIKDRLVSFGGTTINVIANRLGRGHNMFVVARPVGVGSRTSIDRKHGSPTPQERVTPHQPGDSAPARGQPVEL